MRSLSASILPNGSLIRSWHCGVRPRLRTAHLSPPACLRDCCWLWVRYQKHPPRLHHEGCLLPRHLLTHHAADLMSTSWTRAHQPSYNPAAAEALVHVTQWWQRSSQTAGRNILVTHRRLSSYPRAWPDCREGPWGEWWRKPPRTRAQILM